ncbi:hypothetical protein [Salinirubrum litoreum]|uniref:UbiC transcription regulator-associated domain-containing protein n=1 Tax=Salinirubrum litoreum TaxID=1126234 RepID=A0ABD5RCY8_9EURY|nr:hypothetical protein [Salinirubrum litoreum]
MGVPEEADETGDEGDGTDGEPRQDPASPTATITTEDPELSDLPVTLVAGDAEGYVGRETVVVGVPNANETDLPAPPWSREYAIRLGVSGTTLAVDLRPAGLSLPTRLLAAVLRPLGVADPDVPGSFGPPLGPVDARLREAVQSDAVLASVQMATDGDDDRVLAGRCLVHAPAPGVRTLHFRYDREFVTCDGPVELPVRRE